MGWHLDFGWSTTWRYGSTIRKLRQIKWNLLCLLIKPPLWEPLQCWQLNATGSSGKWMSYQHSKWWPWSVPKSVISKGSVSAALMFSLSGPSLPITMLPLTYKTAMTKPSSMSNTSRLGSTILFLNFMYFIGIEILQYWANQIHKENDLICEIASQFQMLWRHSWNWNYAWWTSHWCDTLEGK